MAKKKTTAKKPAAKKRSPAKKAAAKPELTKPKEEAPAFVPPKYGILVYLRNTSKTWPVKIGPYRFNKEYKLWLYSGKPIEVDEWNENGNKALDDIATQYDYLPNPIPGFKFIEMPPEKDDEPWKENIAKAHTKQREEATPPEIKDERTGPEERPPAPSLY